LSILIYHFNSAETVIKREEERKLSGGCGGGITIVLADEGEEDLDFFKDMGFAVRKVSIDYNGAKVLSL